MCLLCANMSGFCLGWVSDVRKKDEFAALMDENCPVASMEVQPLRLADTPSSRVGQVMLECSASNPLLLAQRTYIGQSAEQYSLMRRAILV